MTDDIALSRSLLRDAFGRIREGVPVVVDGLSTAELLWRPDPAANSIAWLVWHLARQQDDQLAALAATDPAWCSAGWVGRFALPYPPDVHGYGMSAQDVRAFRLDDPSLLTGYHADVHGLTLALVESLTPDRCEQVIDRSWDPPVTVGVRVVSVLDDAARHLGQAEYLRGLVLRRR